MHRVLQSTIPQVILGVSKLTNGFQQYFFKCGRAQNVLAESLSRLKVHQVVSCAPIFTDLEKVESCFPTQPPNPSNHRPHIFLLQQLNMVERNKQRRGNVKVVYIAPQSCRWSSFKLCMYDSYNMTYWIHTRSLLASHLPLAKKAFPSSEEKNRVIMSHKISVNSHILVSIF